MGLREELQKRIERKEQEKKELHLKIREADAYIQGLQDTLRILPREVPGELKDGTDLAAARDAIAKAGRPLHVQEILKALNKPATKMNRASLSGNLAAYVRRDQIFTRPAPNTFGLRSLKVTQEKPLASEEPPPGFGGEDDGAPPDDDIPF